MKIDKTNSIPIYVQLMEIIKEEIKINKLQPGDKISSERELMKRYDVNHITLSRAIRELVYQEVLYRQQGRGTFVSDQKKKKKSMSAIAIMVPDVSYFFPPVIRKVEYMAHKHNYNLIVCNTDGQVAKEEKYIEDFLNNGCKGLIIKPIYKKNNNNYLKLKENNFPFVMLDQPPCGIKADCIITNDEEGGYDACMHLIELGHKKIACVGTRNVFSRAAHDRESGYEKALKASGLKLDRELVKITDYLLEKNKEKFSSLIEDMMNQKNKPTAIFALNDFIAQKAMEVIRSRGLKIPGDIALAGYDNSDIATDPNLSLTSVSLPKEEMGKKAVSMLMARIKAGNNKDYKKIFLPHKLIIRKSSAGAEYDSIYNTAVTKCNQQCCLSV